MIGSNFQTMVSVSDVAEQNSTCTRQFKVVKLTRNTLIWTQNRSWEITRMVLHLLTLLTGKVQIFKFGQYYALGSKWSLLTLIWAETGFDGLVTL